MECSYHVGFNWMSSNVRPAYGNIWTGNSYFLGRNREAAAVMNFCFTNLWRICRGISTVEALARRVSCTPQWMSSVVFTTIKLECWIWSVLFNCWMTSAHSCSLWISLHFLSSCHQIWSFPQSPCKCSCIQILTSSGRKGVPVSPMPPCRRAWSVAML